MKFKKLVGLAVIVAICGGTIVTASAEAKKLIVAFNDVVLNNAGSGSEAGVLELANQFQSIVETNKATGKISLYKPNVDLIFIRIKDNKMFGSVHVGDKFSFTTVIQVDQLLTDVSDIKIDIVDPGGKSETIQSFENPDSKEDFWGRTEAFNYTFDAKGTCFVRVSMKSASSGQWFVVKEKSISVV